MTTDSHDERLLEQAFDWLLALHESPEDSALVMSHAQWSAASPAHVSAAQRAQRLWQIGGAMQPQPIATPASVARASRPRRWQRALIASVAVLAAVVVLPDLWRIARSDYRTGSGEHRELSLADGSRLQLDSHTAIALDFSAGQRRVRVLEGHAFFDVAPDPARPFSVEAQQVRATDIGTAFEVGLQAANVIVAVESGIVRVDAGGARLAELSAGQQIAVAPSQTKSAVQDIAPQLVASWRSGQLMVDDLSIAEVAERLRAYTPAVIVVTDRALAQRRVSGIYSLADPQAALEAVVQPHGGQVRKITPWLLIVSPA